MSLSLKNILGENYNGRMSWDDGDERLIPFAAFPPQFLVADHNLFMMHLGGQLSMDQRDKYAHVVNEVEFQSRDVTAFMVENTPSITYLKDHPETGFVLVWVDNVFGVLMFEEEHLEECRKYLITEDEANAPRDIIDAQFMRFDDKFVVDMELEELNQARLGQYSTDVNNEIVGYFPDTQKADMQENFQQESAQENQIAQEQVDAGTQVAEKLAAMSTNNAPVVIGIVSILAPSAGMALHEQLQKLTMTEEARNTKQLVALNEIDMKNAFGIDAVVDGFYTFIGTNLTYVDMAAMRHLYKSGEPEMFGIMFHLDYEAVKTLGMDPAEMFRSFGKLPAACPLTVLVPHADFANSPLRASVNDLSTEQFATTTPRTRYNFDTFDWEENDEVIDKAAAPRRMHLKDIPLNTRANRRMVRSSIEVNKQSLVDQWEKQKYDDGVVALSFEDWLTQSQGVNVQLLNSMVKIDSLPDSEYVAAFSGHQKVAVQALYKKDVEAGLTDLGLHAWVLKHYEVEFEDLGKEQALKDMEGIGDGPQEVGEVDADFGPAIFVVAFDGTVVENRFPEIGAVAPYALETIRALLDNDHHVLIYTKRAHDIVEMRKLKDFFEAQDIVPSGYVSSVMADGEISVSNVKFPNATFEDFLKEEVEGDYFDYQYLVSANQFAAPKMTLSTADNAGTIMYWGDLVGALYNYGYVNEDQMQEMIDIMNAAATDQPEPQEETPAVEETNG